MMHVIPPVMTPTRLHVWLTRRQVARWFPRAALRLPCVLRAKDGRTLDVSDREELWTVKV